MPQPVDLVVDRGVLLDVEVLVRDVGLGLVVVVVGDEVLDRVVGEELPDLAAELGRQRLVVGEHERGLLDLLDRETHRGGLARAGDAEQRLEALAPAEALGKLRDRLRLVRDRLVGTVELERRHAFTSLESGLRPYGTKTPCVRKTVLPAAVSASPSGPPSKTLTRSRAHTPR